MLKYPAIRTTIFLIFFTSAFLIYTPHIYGEISDKEREQDNALGFAESRALGKTVRLEKTRQINSDLDKIENKRKIAKKRIPPDLGIELAIDYQRVNGKQIFEVIDSGGQRISKLTYPIKGEIVTIKGEVKLHPKFSIGGSYGSSDLKKTTCSDEDWNFTGLHNGELTLIDYQITEQNCKSKLEIFDINVYWHFLNIDTADSDKKSANIFAVDRFSMDIFGGYQQQKGWFRMKDPITQYLRTVDGTLWQASGLPLYQGLDSSYKVIYRGPKLGLRVEGINKKLSTRLSASYGWIETKAHGWWNLRNYSFSQKSSHLGYALILDLDIRYHLNATWFIGIGYNYAEYNQEKLKESGVQPGYTYDDLDIIRNVNNKVYGPFIMLGCIW